MPPMMPVTVAVMMRPGAFSLQLSACRPGRKTMAYATHPIETNRIAALSISHVLENREN